jgi:GT2 family glycosyltransferase
MGTTCCEKVKSAVSVSVLICVKNCEKYIGDCINSLLAQTYIDFEILIIEEYDSNDRTRNIIENFEDKRIRYFRNKRFLGIAKSRNLSVKYSKGEYIFFTDGDCIVSQDWIEQGLKSQKNSNCVGVEGMSYNVSEAYEPTFSDHFYKMKRGEFMTNNIAYRRNVVLAIGGFDERYSFHEDRDLALRALRFGRIEFNPNMKVFVQQQTLTPKDILKRSEALRNKVFLFKRFGETKNIVWRVVEPVSLVKIFFPPLFLASLFSKRLTKSEDFRLVPFHYISLIYSRLKLWKESARERIFLI